MRFLTPAAAFSGGIRCSAMPPGTAAAVQQLTAGRARQLTTLRGFYPPKGGAGN
nr:hypothetical protein [uncultured Roseateles sp.]